MNSEDAKCHMTKKEATLWMPRAVAQRTRHFLSMRRSLIGTSPYHLLYTLAELGTLHVRT